MLASDVIGAITAAGFTVSANAGRLVVMGTRDFPSELATLLQGQKAAVLAHLAAPAKPAHACSPASERQPDGAYAPCETCGSPVDRYGVCVDCGAGADPSVL